MRYKVKLSDEAQNDFDEYINFILFEYSAPLTAERHYNGIVEEIVKLSKNPFVNSIRYNASLTRYGLNVRRANYKKMAIIYTVHNDTVYIHRVIAQKNIAGLN